MSWHHLAMCRPPPTLPSPQILVKSMKINENTCPGAADLFQSESVLDYIVINPYLAILQTPISHYCNTLQSPIQQIAVYLYCRMHLALLHHLKGLG